MEKYNCVEYIPRDDYKNADEILSYVDTLGNSFSNSVNKFFSNKTVLKAVKEDNWIEVFNLWHKSTYGNDLGWFDVMLCDLLYFLNIDFWNYLPCENLEDLEKFINIRAHISFKKV